MPEFDAESLTEHAVMLGLVNNEQAFQAKVDAADGSAEALLRSMLRKGMLTSWQIERLKKGDPSGFFFGGCKVLFHIAEGTFARVYRGERITEARPVAIKVLRQRFVADPAAIMRFNKEAEAGMKLEHPNIVQILDFGEHEKKYFMVMEYVEGSNLRDLLKIRTRLEAKAALPLMIGLARGLKYSHDCGVTHRDIKATNILISHSGIGKLVDFGLATIEGEDKKMAALNERTVDYSALERRCLSPKGDPRSDIFFLGCVFYQMLSGHPAMPESESKDMLVKMLKRSLDAIKPLGDHPNAPDQELTRIVEKMMKIELKSRYQNMDEVLADLLAYEEYLKSPETARAGRSEPTIEDEPIFLFRGDEIEIIAPAKEEAEGEHHDDSAHEDGEMELLEHEVKAHHAKQVLCVEAQAEIQDAFRKTLSRMGYRAILVGDAERGADRYREAPTDAVIFDADGLGAEGIDALLDMREKAQEDGLDFNALVLLGVKQAHLREKIPASDRLVVLGKPVKMKQVQEAIARLLPPVDHS